MCSTLSCYLVPEFMDSTLSFYMAALGGSETSGLVLSFFQADGGAEMKLWESNYGFYITIFNGG